ncbi:hypothetical protein OUZ56_003890 [Daphnia magna]|uniref:Uncharacterized protein n=1 Tax=Daphnia magna TaxID=35525 RepID=A0ABQ9YN39_9CRUS|nr:hypothetical protein OUZ56_003890 [Daphnia magna]
MMEQGPEYETQTLAAKQHTQCPTVVGETLVKVSNGNQLSSQQTPETFKRTGQAQQSHIYVNTNL